MTRRDREKPKYAEYGINQMHKALGEIAAAARAVRDGNAPLALINLELASENLGLMVDNFVRAGAITEQEATSCPNPWKEVSSASE